MSQHTFKYNNTFELESGESLPGLSIAYHTYGKLNENKSNVIWIFHALTANSDAADWWSGLVGEKKVFDSKKYFIVCANILGSCYGTSGPLSLDPSAGSQYFRNFPMITIRDMVKAHQLLKNHLEINKIAIGAGGSMGAYQLLEWAVIEPAIFDKIVLAATSAQESAWGIAIHTAQRLAIEADQTFNTPNPKAGSNGLKAARAIGMLTYRNYEAFVKSQTDKEEKLDEYKASSYIHYQGEKLVKRFNAHSYWLLTKSMDSHNLARGRGKMINVLKKIKAKTLVIGISSDILCPVAEQKFLGKYIPKSKLHIINSTFGHDGFLVEWKKLSALIKPFIKN